MWESQLVGFKRLGEWSESSFSDALLLQGLSGRDPRTQPLVEQLRCRGPYSLEVTFSPHSRQKMEPLTGADLAVVVDLRVDNDAYQKKLFLVQLKKGEIADDGRVEFPDLHYKSGRRQRLIGKDVHQAEKMLLFTPASVYWLSVPADLSTDTDFYSRFALKNSFAVRGMERPRQGGTTTPGIAAANLGWPFASPRVLHEPELLECWECMYNRVIGYSIKESKRFVAEEVERLEALRRDAFVRALKQDAGTEAARSRPGSIRWSTIVAHADAVCSLSSRSFRDLGAVSKYAAPLPQFVLGDVIADGFGDENQQLITSLTGPRADDFIRGRLRDAFGAEDESDDSPPAGGVLTVKVQIQTSAGESKDSKR